ncbi:MAG: pilus assembly protein PilP [Elusimicrobia bacterium]|nr:pilus assembly protein PilP [Elusimicrobiota bacterium]
MIKILYLLFMSLTLSSCSKKNVEENLNILYPETQIAVQKKIVPQLESAKKEPIPRFIYGANSGRDPFLPLIGDSSSSKGVKSQTRRDPQRSAENFSQLELKGILKDKDGKIALIISRDGESFTLKSGKLYDKRSQTIQNITGIIKETSVVLYGKNKTIKELHVIKK